MNPRLAKRLKWLTFLRLLVILLSLTAIISIEGRWRTLEARHLPPYWTLSIACALSLLYLLWIRSGAGFRTLSLLQIHMDSILISLLVYFTGFHKLFALLYFGVVIASSILLGTRWGIATASLSTIALSGISLLYFFAFTDYLAEPLSLPGVDPSVGLAYSSELAFLLPYLFFFALSLHVVGLLAGKLSEEASRIRLLNEEILENMEGGVLAVDRTGLIAFVSSQAESLLELQSPRPVGRPYREVLPEELGDLIALALHTRGRIERELPDGATPLHVTISTLKDERTRAVRGIVAILTDLSVRRRLEDAQHRAERFRALLEMSAGMAHEIRNPLASIRGAAQELSGPSPAGPDDEKLLDVIVRESDRLEKIIREFLEYAAPKPLAASICDLSRILHDVVVVVDARSDTRLLKIDEQMPGAALVKGDENRLKQVFLNLLLNALEACGGKGVLRVRCTPRTAGTDDPRDGFEVEIHDEGDGIAEEDLARIFDPFFTTRPTGTGMGLPIARKIVQAHEGKIEIDSRK